MRRGKLISRGHRQLWLARSVLARQPLVARLTKHQRLSQEFGLSAIPGHAAEIPGRAIALPGRKLDQQEQSYLLPNGIMFRPALAVQAQDEYVIAKAPEEPVYLAAQQAAHMSPPPEQEQEQGEPSVVEVVSEPEIVVPTSLEETATPGEPERVFIQPVASRVDMETSVGMRREGRDQEPIDANEHPELPAISQVEREGQKVTLSAREREAEALMIRHEEVAQSVSSDEPEAPVIQSEEVSQTIEGDALETELATRRVGELPQRLSGDEPESVSLEVPSKHKDADGQVQPSVESAKPPIEVRKPRRPRRSIEELSAQSARDLTTPSQPSQLPEETPRTQRDVQGTRAHEQPQNTTASKSAETTAADELFTPTNTDRSPQAWLARLMGKSLPVSQPATTAEPIASSAEATLAPSSTILETTQDDSETVTREGSTLVPLIGTNVTDIRKGAGSGAGLGRPLWSPAVTTPEVQPIGKVGDAGEAGDHKDPPSPSTPSSPLRKSFKPLYSGEAQANAAPDVPPTRPVPTPVSMHTRRFLRPLVGIDPASARVHRDAEARRLTNAYRADAITVGNEVEVAVGHTADTPETLGLLAHEFTHVARQREPNFIPPIARAASPASISQPASGQGSTSSPLIAHGASEPSSTTSEEALALHVERQVRRTAREHQGQLGQSGQSKLQTRSVSTTPASGPIPASPPTSHRTPNDPWGGLPAPWEPLPDWMASPPNTATSATPTTSVSPAQLPQATRETDRGIVETPLAGVLGGGSAGVLGNGSLGTGATSIGVQRAGAERSLGVGAAPPLSSPSAVANMSPALEPDLDDLARQVYSRLKRRLEVERQRFS